MSEDQKQTSLRAVNVEAADSTAQQRMEARAEIIKIKPKLPPREQRTVIAPLPGHEWNPLRDLPRNRPCPCRSGQKFKLCCLNRMPKAVPTEVAKQYREQMAKPDLVFITKENQEKLAAQAVVKEMVDAPEGNPPSPDQGID